MTKPFLTQWLEIEPGWIDYNNHLNMGYYTVLFDRAADEAFENFGFGEDYIARTNHTTFSGEFHLRYLREVRLGDKLRSTFYLIDHDDKKFHTYQELTRTAGFPPPAKVSPCMSISMVPRWPRCPTTSWDGSAPWPAITRACRAPRGWAAGSASAARPDLYALRIPPILRRSK